jgi:hypothetical protein
MSWARNAIREGLEAAVFDVGSVRVSVGPAPPGAQPETRLRARANPKSDMRGEGIGAA